MDPLFGRQSVALYIYAGRRIPSKKELNSKERINDKKI
jgi:hypothetical protein